jgi:hypothetical protein
MTSGKAREDLDVVAEELGYQVLEESQFDDWKNQIRPDDIVLFPFPNKKGSEAGDLFMIKTILSFSAKIITLAYNVDYLRYPDADRASIIEALENSHVVISMTEKMAEQLKQDGVTTPPITTLGLFDYLLDKTKKTPANYKKEIIFAGSPYKVPYAANWTNKTPLKVYSRREEFPEPNNGNLSYGGYFPPEQLPFEIKDGFGLIFDADSDTGTFAEYQTMNTPHKASLFLNAGVPILVNRRAAVANIILGLQAGIAIDSVDDIDDVIKSLSKEEYDFMAKNALMASPLIANGYFYRKAIISAETLI